MSKVITIGREYGSGGRLIAQGLAQKLGIPFYDKEIIFKASEISGLDPNFVEEMEQKLNNKLLFNFSSVGHFFSGVQDTNYLSLEDQVFFAQCKVIRHYADEGPCVIVGRCASFVLKDGYETFDIFIHADLQQRIERIRKYYGVTGDPEALIKKIDKQRSRHFEYYTDHKWGQVENYDLTINSALFSVEGVVDILANASKRFLEGEEV